MYYYDSIINESTLNTPNQLIEEMIDAENDIEDNDLYIADIGEPFPAGATLRPGGVNFSVFSRKATQVSLLLFESHDSIEPFQVITLDPKRNRTFFFWHVFIEGLPINTAYAFRVDGPKDLHGAGDRYDSAKVLLDPWAMAQTHSLWKKEDAEKPGIDNLETSMRGLIVDPDDYDWEGDRPLVIDDDDLIIYEMHAAGFTKSKTSKVRYPGTFAGITEKIPYLKSLGITAIELLPVMAYDPYSVPKSCPTKVNYWGYNTVSFFSPHPDYCISPEKGTHLNEFRDMVKALHRAGIAVILDVVFNHTAEAGHAGPTINFKGFCNEFFYHLNPEDKKHYRDYTGCGNTLNSNHPFVTQFTISCLEFWVKEMHVDGFRFDLASALSRGEDGTPMYHSPLLWSIEFSRNMLRSKIIAEAWDAAGLYQVGYFPGIRWKEWNGLFRDDIRRFLRGDEGIIGKVAQRISGSADLYQQRGRQPTSSVNFITSHDGFTLNDLFSYHKKYNHENGEENRDGHNENLSYNCGYEGPTKNLSVERLRKRQIKNAIALLMLSHGVPMILGGDECRRTQRGNNNAYCQDNDIGWFDWKLPKRHSDIFRFTKKMIAFRKNHAVLKRTRYVEGNRRNVRGIRALSWHGVELDKPGFDDPFARAIAYTLGGPDDGSDLHIMINMYTGPLRFELPKLHRRCWHRAIDTFLADPEDITNKQGIQINETHYWVQPQSIVVLRSGEDCGLRPDNTETWPDWS